MLLRLERLISPIGAMLLVTDEAGAVRALHFAETEDDLRDGLRRRAGAHELAPGSGPAAVRTAIAAYFDGDVTALDAIEVEAGGAPFQRKVWAALREIPAGETTTYGRLAAALGHPKASRAVGFANHVNPVAVIVPCHRVVGANGALTGYASGLERKRWLLDHERAGLGGALFVASHATPCEGAFRPA